MSYKDFGTDIEAAIGRMRLLGNFQLLHNELRQDFAELYLITGNSIDSGKNCPGLIRACLKELFSLMEADIYHLNYIDPYDGYDDDRQSFIDKFKDTYKHHCRSHERFELYEKFLNLHLATLRELRQKRNSITHPKSKEDVQVDNSVFEKTHILFKAYSDFVVNAMTDTGVTIQSPTLSEFFQRLSNH